MKGAFKNNDSFINSQPSTMPHRSILPQGVEKENIISINARKRKISITGPTSHDMRSIEHDQNQDYVSLHVGREGGLRDTLENETDRAVLSRRVSVGPHSMVLKLLTQLFEARNEDLEIVRKNTKQMEQFIKRAETNSIKRKLIMKEMGFGNKSATVLSQLIRVGANIAKWTHIDLSMNKLGINFEPIVRALKVNTQLVSLRLSNNELGQSHIQLLKQLILEHPSITDIDLSNDDSN